MQSQPSFTYIVFRCLFSSLKAGISISIILAAAVLLLSDLAEAQTFSEEVAKSEQHFNHPGEVRQGTLLFKGEHDFTSAPILHTDVQFTVTGMLVRAHVKQRFRNPSEEWQEGVYVFPLPENAAVDHMRMKIGERIIEGQIKEKEAAKKQYQRAKKAGKKTSLVEQERPNIFTTSVANIAPYETIVVEIEYQQVARYDLGSFSLRFPMVVAPRYIPGNMNIDGFAGSGWAKNTEQVPDAARITPPVLKPGKGKVNPVNISINLDAGLKIDNINSPYHDIKVTNNNNNLYRINLKKGDVPADRDFVLNWQPKKDKEPQAAFFKEEKDGEEYGLLMVLPPQKEQSRILKREVIFVIDTSGSMAGASITQARAALELAMSRLKNGDSFNIIQFNSYTSQLFSTPQLVSPQSLKQASHYIRSLQAQGGTEMAPAIRAALTNQYGQYDLRQVIFLTDGSVGNENALFKIIEHGLLDSRLFTVGIGSAPNSHFMERAAKFGRGTHTYVGSTNEVQEKMADLFRKLENPVLSDITINWPNNLQVESWPQKLPDLYLGEPLLFSAKAVDLPKKIEIAGRIAGTKWQTNLSLKGGNHKQGISVLWARRKIAALMTQRVRSNEADAIRQQIIATALKHHLVSKYTSLVAVDITPARKQDEILKKHALPTNLPAGWKHQKVFGTMPKTATPATLFFLLGSILLVISFVYFYYPLASFRETYLGKRISSLFTLHD